MAGIIKEQNLIGIVETLAKMVIDAGNKEVRDIYSLAIQSTINELKENSAANMIRTVYPNMNKGLNTNKPEVQEECLEILAQIFKKFGQLLNKNNNLVNKDDLMKTLIELLQNGHPGVRKRTTNCMGQFAIILNSRQLEQLITILMRRLKASEGTKKDLLTQIQCISQIARSVGSKLARFYGQLVPQLTTYPAVLEEE